MDQIPLHSGAPNLSSKIVALLVHIHCFSHFPQVCRYAWVIGYGGLSALATHCVNISSLLSPAQPPHLVTMSGLPVLSLPFMTNAPPGALS